MEGDPTGAMQAAHPPPACAAVLLAAGRSTRMTQSARGADKKPFLELGGRTLLERSFDALVGTGWLCEIVVVLAEEDLERGRALLAAATPTELPRSVVPGGAERTDSVRCGVAALGAGSDVVLIHDAARPLVRSERVRAVALAAREHGAALLATPVRDTIKAAEGPGAAEAPENGPRTRRTLDRAALWAAHTPQAFRTGLLRELLERAARDGFRPTDDAALHERYAGPVRLVEDDSTNIKVTTAEDLWVAEALWSRRAGGAP